MPPACPAAILHPFILQVAACEAWQGSEDSPAWGRRTRSSWVGRLAWRGDPFAEAV